MAIYDIDCPGGWLLLVINTFANPIFVYFLSSFFTQQNIARQAVLFIYLLASVMLPLVIAILQVVTDTTKEVARILKWCFMPIPVFSTCLGMLNIILRKFLTFIFYNDGSLGISDPFESNDRFTNGNFADGLKPFDKQIALWMLLFLLFAIVVYWVLLVLIEGRFLSFCFRSITGNN